MPSTSCLAAGVAAAAATMQTGRQLPATLCDEAQDAVAALYLLLQVRIRRGNRHSFLPSLQSQTSCTVSRHRKLPPQQSIPFMSYLHDDWCFSVGLHLP